MLWERPALFQGAQTEFTTGDGAKKSYLFIRGPSLVNTRGEPSPEVAVEEAIETPTPSPTSQPTATPIPCPTATETSRPTVLSSPTPTLVSATPIPSPTPQPFPAGILYVQLHGRSYPSPFRRVHRVDRPPHTLPSHRDPLRIS